MATTAKKKKAPVTALAKRPVATLAKAEAPLDMSPMAIMERLAKDPGVDVGKMQALVDLQKDMMAVQAKRDFEAAYLEMHPKLPIIQKNGSITKREKNSDGSRGQAKVQSRFARYSEDILEVVAPILAEHGFTLRHRTSHPTPQIIRTTGYLTHIGGHTETSDFEAPADKMEYRTDIQSMGSTRSYGRRYTTRDLLNLKERGQDDDGNAAGRMSGSDPVSRQRAQEAPRPVPVAPVHHDADGDKPITEAQVTKLVDAVVRSGRKQPEWKGFLRLRFGIERTEELKRQDFDFVVAAVQSPRPLPVEVER